MAIEKRYLHYNTESAFLIDKNNGNINAKSIVFISEKGKRAIYTHGKFFSTDSFVIGTQTHSTNQFLGTYNGAEELFDGMSIKYWLPYSSTGASSLNLTIQGKQTGNIPIYTYGSTRYEDTSLEGCVLFLVYRKNVEGIGQGWWVINGTGTGNSSGGSGGSGSGGGTGNYIFESGTGGSFKVTDGEGNSQTISVGKPASAGQADTALTAGKVSKSFTLQIDSGSTQGTNLFTYDGSEAKKINITSSGGITLDTNTDGELEIIGTTYSNATISKAGLMSSTDKKKLNGLSNYTHPSYTESSLGLYKISIDGLGHVDSLREVNLEDLKELGVITSSKNIISTSSTGTTEIFGNTVYLNSITDGSVVSSYKIVGEGITTISSSSTGKTVKISSTPTWSSITGKPSTFTPSSHSHNLEDISNINTKSITINGLESKILYTGTDNLPSSFVAPASFGNSGQFLQSTSNGLTWTTIEDKNTWRSIYFKNSSGTKQSLLEDNYKDSFIIKPGTNITLSSTTVKGELEISSIPTWSNITNKPSTFTPSAHKHNLEDISNINTKSITINGSKSKILYTGTNNLPDTIYVPISLGDDGQFLKCTTSGLTWTTIEDKNTWRSIYFINSSGTNKPLLEDNYKDSFIIKPGTNITLSSTTTKGELEISSIPTWSSITGKPNTFTPSTHKHNLSDINNVKAKSITINGSKSDILYTGTDNLPDIIYAPISLGSDGQFLKCTSNGLTWTTIEDKNTWRPVYMKSGSTSTQITSNNSNFTVVQGSNIVLSRNTTGELIISSTQKTYKLEGESDSTGYKLSIEESGNSVTVPLFSSNTLGLVPKSSGSSSEYLRGDGTWGSIAYGVVSTTGNGLAPKLATTTTSATSEYYALMWSGKSTMTTPSWIKLPGKAFSWRTINVNRTSIGDNSLSLNAGDNITLTVSNGEVYISSSYVNSLAKLYIGSNSNTTKNETTTNGNTYIKLFDGNNTTPYKFNIKGEGRVSVNSDASGNITITSPSYSGGTNISVSENNISHSTIKTTVTDNTTTTTSALGFGDEFIVTSDITYSNGHITGFTKKKYSLPTISVTDENVKITNTTTSVTGDRGILFAHSEGNNTVTEGVRKSSLIKANPGTGKVTAKTFKSTETTEAPFEVASSKMVEKLNAQYLGGKLANAFSLVGHTHTQYLPLTGGTLDPGKPTNGSDPIFQILNIKRQVADGIGVAIHFSGEEGLRGAIGIRSKDGNFLRWKTNWSTAYSLLDTGNTAIKRKSSTTSSDDYHTFTASLAGTEVSWTQNKVAQKPSSSNSNYPILLAGTVSPGGALGTTNYDSDVTVNPSTGTLSAKIISGETIEGSLDASVTAVTQDSDTPSTNLVATTGFVKNLIGSSVGNLTGAMVFKGSISDPTKLPAVHEVGWVYRVSSAGTYAGQACEIGDLVICITKGSAANNSHWTVGQNNIDGSVYSISTSSTEGNFVVFGGTNGRVIKKSDYNASSFTYKAEDKHLALSSNTFSLYAINTSSTTLGSQGSNNALTIKSGGSFTVPKITVDSYGRTIVKDSANVTITIPKTDVVLQSPSTTTAKRAILLGTVADNDSTKWGTTGQSYYNTSIYAVPSSGKIVATTFEGTLEGFASGAYKLVSSTDSKGLTVGSADKPVYFSDGIPSACTKYAGGTQITLNGESMSGSEAKIYAPINGGASGQVLISTGGEPTWKNLTEADSYSKTVSFAVTTSWTSIISATDMGTLIKGGAGTYAIQLKSTKAGICSGIMSWNTSGTTSDEILLHRTGASTNVYLRLSSRALQIAGAAGITKENITITFKKLI